MDFLSQRMTDLTTQSLDLNEWMKEGKIKKPVANNTAGTLTLTRQLKDVELGCGADTADGSGVSSRNTDARHHPDHTHFDFPFISFVVVRRITVRSERLMCNPRVEAPSSTTLYLCQDNR